MEKLYPAGPQGVPAALTQPSAIYKRRAWLAMASLALFVVIYFALAGWFVWTAYRMFGEAAAGDQDQLLSFLIGGCAAFLALFMLKALFFVQRGGASDAVEVTAAEQPRLFEFLYRLADEAGAPRPKRVYLSARVNAAVFYDLSILNLLFPSRKNLEIGLALVNVLTLSEMKAVLAHEFGHFAQRTMAIGSWVYIAQQIASHVIAKRDALDKFLQGLNRIDLRLAWIGWLLSLIVWSIRSLMDTLLRLVVLAQRALSRQMEFQADLVAVSLTGSDELVHALHKLQAADEAWSRTLSFADAQLRQERKPHDLFAVQTQIIDKVGEILGDEQYGKVPPSNAEKMAAHRVFKTSFAQPPQMWSTHPANADREENAKRHYIPAAHDARSAWELFDDITALKERVIASMTGEIKAAPASAEDTLKALQERYALLQYAPHFKGAYLGRALTRYAARPEELYQSDEKINLLTALSKLYSSALAQDLELQRELNEERATLQALRDKVYQATGGRIVFRGREIGRRQLPGAIDLVTQEQAQVRQRILAHDRQCRSAHLAAAELLGGDWREYLIGLIKVLHYTEHTEANLRDAQGLLGNVVAVVTADGNVSARELKRLLGTANMLHAVLEQVYRQKTALQLDAALCARLNTESWAALLEEFTLPPASNDNINEWMRVIDGWVNAAAGALASVANAALEELLASEEKLALHIRQQSSPAPAPNPSQVPDQYQTLLPGQERKRQQKLGWWDRFQTADGWLPASARLLVAGGIVGAVLGFSNIAVSTMPLSIYNGLGQTVQVQIASQKIAVPAFSSTQIELPLGQSMTIETRARDDRVIERFTPELSGHTHHYVYNVASASPLVEWTASYGSAAEVPPRFLGAPRWLTSSADFIFAEPPQSVQTKSGGATRSILAGLGQKEPDKLMEILRTDTERKQVATAHATWDEANGKYADEWKLLAQRLGQ